MGFKIELLRLRGVDCSFSSFCKGSWEKNASYENRVHDVQPPLTFFLLLSDAMTSHAHEPLQKRNQKHKKRG